MLADVSVEAPQGPMDLGGVLQDLIQAYCAEQGIDWKEEGLPFLQQLQCVNVKIDSLALWS